MKVKTGELIGPALDWAVAKCVGWGELHNGDKFSPSTDWSQGGPIIERETMNLWRYNNHIKPWFAEKPHFGRHHKAGRSYGEGPAPLIAAMRCYVAATLGDEVEVPDGLF